MVKDDFNRALACLRAGGVIAHATDTCYGFACDATNKRALKKLYALKQMPFSKPVSILVTDLNMAEKYGRFNATSRQLAKEYWPGALTIVVPRRHALPAFVNPGAATVGIRVPNHEVSRLLAARLGAPITTTSANISGKPSPYSAQDIRRQFRRQKLQPDFIIDEGPLDKKNLPSTVVEIRGSSIKIVRKGSVKIPRRLLGTAP